MMIRFFVSPRSKTVYSKNRTLKIFGLVYYLLLRDVHRLSLSISLSNQLSIYIYLSVYLLLRMSVPYTGSSLSVNKKEEKRGRKTKKKWMYKSLTEQRARNKRASTKKKRASVKSFLKAGEQEALARSGKKRARKKKKRATRSIDPVIL